jgi:hypothetical protein
MSNHSPLESFHNELFINEVEQLPAIWDPRPFRTTKNKQQFICGRQCAKKKLLKA